MRAVKVLELLLGACDHRIHRAGLDDLRVGILILHLAQVHETLFGIAIAQPTVGGNDG